MSNTARSFCICSTTNCPVSITHYEGEHPDCCFHKPATPHFHEPWQKNLNMIGSVVDCRGAYVVDSVEKMQRAKDCVNACAGMTDPEKEIGKLRQGVEGFAQLLREVHLELSYAQGPNIGVVRNHVRAAFAKIAPLFDANACPKCGTSMASKGATGTGVKNQEASVSWQMCSRCGYTTDAD